MIALFLALAAAIVPVTPQAVNFPCDGAYYATYWANTTGQTIYIKRLVVNHQAAAGMWADLHVTVWHGWPGGSQVVLIAPWDRYTDTPKVPAEATFAPDAYELPAGHHLAFQSGCSVVWSPHTSNWHLPQPQFWYTTAP